MKTTLFALIFLLGQQLVAQKDTSYYKKYFFGNLFLENGYELVVITKEPQTALAKEIGSRIYSDSATLQYMEQQFFSWEKKGLEINHYCGFDLYFYLKKGNDLKYFSCANSHCGISGLGGGDRDMCSNIEFLAEKGTMLVADTIYSFPDSIRSKSMMREVYFQDHIYSEFRDISLEVSSYDLWAKSARNVPLYYDGYISFPLSIYRTFEEDHEVNTMIRERLLQLGIDADLNNAHINWSMSDDELIFYFTKDVYPLFDANECKPLNLPKPDYRFDPPLLLWKIP